MNAAIVALPVALLTLAAGVIPVLADGEATFAGTTVLKASDDGAMRLTLTRDAFIQDIQFLGKEPSDYVGVFFTGPKHFLLLEGQTIRWPPWNYYNIDLSVGLPAGEYHAYVVAPRPIEVVIRLAGLEGMAAYDLPDWTGDAVRLTPLRERYGMERVELPGDGARVDQFVHVREVGTPYYPPAVLAWEDFRFDRPAALLTVEFTGGKWLGFRHSVVSDSGAVKCKAGQVVPGAGFAASWKLLGFTLEPGAWQARMEAFGVTGHWSANAYTFAVPLLPGDAFLNWSDPLTGRVHGWLPDEEWLPRAVRSQLPVPWDEAHAALPEPWLADAMQSAYCTPLPALPPERP
jgi:hypothetical protein